MVVLVDETDAVITSENGRQSFREVPSLAVLGRNDDFSSFDIEVAALAILFAEDCQAIPFARFSRHPSELLSGVLL